MHYTSTANKNLLRLRGYNGPIFPVWSTQDKIELRVFSELTSLIQLKEQVNNKVDLY